MNHQEKKEIFNVYAKYQGFDDWRALLTSCLESWFMNACDLVQEEQQRRIAENARLGWVKCDDCNCTSEQSEFRCPDNLGIQIDSIINPENKIS